MHLFSKTVDPVLVRSDASYCDNIIESLFYYCYEYIADASWLTKIAVSIQQDERGGRHAEMARPTTSRCSRKSKFSQRPSQPHMYMVLMLEGAEVNWLRKGVDGKDISTRCERRSLCKAKVKRCGWSRAWSVSFRLWRILLRSVLFLHAVFAYPWPQNPRFYITRIPVFVSSNTKTLPQ